MTKVEEVIVFILKRFERGGAIDRAGQEIMLAQLQKEFDDVDTDKIIERNDIGVDNSEVLNEQTTEEE